MHILYVDHDQYFNYHNPNSNLVPLSIAGVQELRFAKLSEAVQFYEDNRDNFTFIDGDDPRVTAYWRFLNMWEQHEADSNRKRHGSNTNR